MKRSIDEIEDELDDLQLEYINEDDEVNQIEIESKFSHLLQEATALDQVDRIAASVTINNWVRDTVSKRDE
jgi:hypothetical protein